MAVLRPDQKESVTKFAFTGETATKAEAETLAFEDLTPRRAPPPAAAPPPEAPRAPEAPPPPPVFEIPEQLVTALYEDAVLRGLEEGKAQVMAELTVLQERYAAALDQLAAVSRQLVDRNKVTLISLSCRVAEKLVRHHLSLHPDQLLGMIREVLNDLEDRDEVVIHCSAADHAFLTSRRLELTQGLGDAFRVQVVAEEGLEYGDFRVETRTGSADGRIESRLAEAQDAMLKPDGSS